MAKAQSKYFEVFTLDGKHVYLAQYGSAWEEGILYFQEHPLTKQVALNQIDILIQDLWLLRTKLSETCVGSDKTLNLDFSPKHETRNNKSKKVSHTAQKANKINKTGAKKK